MQTAVVQQKVASGNDSQGKSSHDAPSMTLSDLLTQAQQVLRREMPGRYWFTAELSQIKRHASGHVYLELTHRNDNGQTAKAQGTLWAQNTAIIAQFEQQTGIRFDQNLSVMLLGEVSFSPQYGFKINVVDINASFSIGAFELKLRDIRRRLLSLGEAQLNQQLSTPAEFTRVAVIAPANAAGLSDFKTKAQWLDQYGVCQFDYFDASFQGAMRETSIVMAFNQLIRNEHQYDAVCFIRGGGDTAGLNELAEPKLARAICRCPYPVFTGIGHESDKNLLDEYAHRSFSTPSMVVSHIYETIVHNARAAKAAFQRLQMTAHHLCEQQTQRHRHHWLQLCSARRVILADWREQANTQIDKVFSAPRQAIANRRLTLNHQLNQLQSQARLGIGLQKEQVRKHQDVIKRQGLQEIQTARRLVEQTHQRLKEQSATKVKKARQEVGALLSQSTLFCTKLVIQQKSELGHQQKVLHRSAALQLREARQALSFSLRSVAYSVSMHQNQQKRGLEALWLELIREARRSLSAQKNELSHGHQLIEAFDPQKVLERGFALVYSLDGELIKSAAQLMPSQELRLQLKDGAVMAQTHFLKEQGDKHDG